jgi:hypothetical protein
MSKAARRRLYAEAQAMANLANVVSPPLPAEPEPEPERKMTLLPKATTPPAERWEYAYLPETKTEGDTLATLNAAGQDGWEVVEGRQYYWLMKRRLA